MTEQALVSIVVAVYNVESYLSKCLTSLSKQKYQNLEIILVNDGSTDDSLKICNDFQQKDHRFKVINKKNGGLSDARNVGIQAATGQYLIFVDGDDYVSENFCLDAVEGIEQNNADICCMGYIRVDLKGTKVKNIEQLDNGLVDKEVALEYIVKNSYVWDKIYRTTLYKHYQFPIGKLYEDSYTQYKVFDEAKKIAFSPVANYYYVERGNSIVADMGPKTIGDQFDSSNHQYQFYKEKYPNVAQKMEEYMLIRALRYCTYCPKNYNRQLFAQAKTIIKTSPVDPKTLDRRYQITMKLFRFSEPLALLIFRLRKLTNS